ncbi:MAG: phosphoribosylaminoimidazolesuccinocarboxamide synthase [Elusimicrobia bacterium GWA2_69_24]|nr:MAG: phosphoribosylaminoimidazolesuccinocarboxamide synthase [Elusimicrobia bacterium GWA2_69_24]HBL17232.1 phosphoribosylaminoimidazolesuccinocarboxamide synthase [Elusimicrobiota bacterium]
MTTQNPPAPEAVSGLPLFRRGKVRDVYELGADLLLVATDRISAFDCVLEPAIPGKGRILTAISAFWFRKTAGLVPNHVLSTEFDEILPRLPAGARVDRQSLEGRVTLARKARRVDIECVIRGYLAGSAWKEYLQTGSACGHALPQGLVQAQRLETPIFTPAAKADTGHDENISRAELARRVGPELARQLEDLSLALYAEAARHAEPRGLILADTKFEFGFIDGRLSLIDEMLTPDSSRFWDAAAYRPGASPESFDKQSVRDHLERVGWDKRPPAPRLPAEVVQGTLRRYQEALERLTQ